MADHGTARLMARMSWPHRRALSAAAVLAALQSIALLAQPWPLTLAIDHAIDGHALPGALSVLDFASPTVFVIVAAGATIVLTALVGGLDYLAARISEQTAERIGAELRSETFTRGIGLSMRFHDRTRSGELVSRLTTDVGRILDAIVMVTTSLLPDLLLLAGVLAVLVMMNPGLAGVALLAVPLLATLAWHQRRAVRAAQRVARAEHGRLASTATDLLRNVRAIQSFGQHRLATQVFDTACLRLSAAERHAVQVEARWTPRADLALALGSGATFIVGALAVLSGSLTTGSLLVVLAYTRDLYRPVRSLARAAGTFAKVGPAAARIGEVLECTERLPEPVPGYDAPRRPPAIRFEQVTFAYGERLILDRFDLDVRAGETLAVVGPSGMGKSTILSLLLRLYDVDSGAIRLDGLDLRAMRLDALRHGIGYVPQDPWLLDASIIDNITFGTARTTRAAALAAGRIAMVDEFALALPAGYDSHVGEGGALLSGGQRRRIALARAFVSQALLLLLDEPTTSLDGRAAANVLAAVSAVSAERTTILVSHDPAVCTVADRVIDLTAQPSSWSLRHDTTPGEEVRHAYQDAHRKGRAVPPRPVPLAVAVPVPVSQPEP